MNTKILFLIILLFLAPYTNAEETGINLLKPEVVNDIDSVTNDYRFNSAASIGYCLVGVVYNGEVVFTKSYDNDPITRTAEWASISKPLTATIIMQLLASGEIYSLEDNVGDYVSKYANCDPPHTNCMPTQYNHTYLSIRNILNQTTGLPYAAPLWEHGSGGSYDLEYLLVGFEPGSRIEYSSGAYGILGDIIRELTRTGFKDAVEIYIGDPVGASSLTAREQDANPESTYSNWQSPASYVSSSIEGIAKFAAGVLSNTYITESALNQMYNETLGWVTGTSTDGTIRYLAHTGDNGGPKSVIILDMDNKISAAILFEGSSSSLREIRIPWASELVEIMQSHPDPLDNSGTETECSSDSDCSGSDICVDNVCTSTELCTDTDDDGYGSPASESCISPQFDCDNNNADINPGETDILCNGIDEDCSGADDSGTDADGDTYKIDGELCGAIDCNDNNANINPGLSEVCGNQIDENCDGLLDQECNCVDGQTQSCGTDVGLCEFGTQTCSNGEWGDCNEGGGSITDIDIGLLVLNSGNPDGRDRWWNTYLGNLPYVNSVTYVDNSASQETLEGYDLIFMSYSIATGSHNAKTANVPVYFANRKAFNTMSFGAADGGSNSRETIIETQNDHYISSGFNGDITVYAQSSYTSSIDAISQDVYFVASENNNQEECILTLEKGDLDVSSTAAPERRVFNCLGYYFSSSNAFTTDGATLVDRTIHWLMGWDESGGGVNPVPEICDGLDNDCDGVVDNDLIAQPCSLQQGVCTGSTKTCGGVSGWLSCQAGDYGVDYEEVEISCDNIDNDCDGSSDEGLKATYYLDGDGDGYGNSGINQYLCSAPAGYVTNGLDCYDNNASINPGADDNNCDGLDNDCDGVVDNGGDAFCSADIECDDGDSCTIDICSNPSTCSAQCENEEITLCSLDTDGCCPAECDSSNDIDCSPITEKCWNASNGFLARNSDQYRKFCKCAEGNYGYLSTHSRWFASEYSYVDSSNNENWDVSGPQTNWRAIDRVECSDGSWYNTNEDYYSNF